MEFSVLNMLLILVWVVVAGRKSTVPSETNTSKKDTNCFWEEKGTKTNLLICKTTPVDFGWKFAAYFNLYGLTSQWLRVETSEIQTEIYPWFDQPLELWNGPATCSGSSEIRCTILVQSTAFYIYFWHLQFQKHWIDRTSDFWLPMESTTTNRLGKDQVIWRDV